jgi:hypothetical protein
MANNTNVSTLSGLFKEIYADSLSNLIPSGVTLLKTLKLPLYTEKQMDELKKTDLGDMLDLTDEDNYEQHTQLK